MTTLLALGFLSPQDIIILLVIGVLLFGRKLPEVGKYLGKGIVEFKKGLKGIEDEADTAGNVPTRQQDPVQVTTTPAPQRISTQQPKFIDDRTTTATTPTNTNTPSA